MIKSSNTVCTSWQPSTHHIDSDRPRRINGVEGSVHQTQGSVSLQIITGNVLLLKIISISFFISN